jgi:hypothetical protein
MMMIVTENKIDVPFEWLAILLCIRQVSGSNLSPETSYPDSGFSWFFKVPPPRSQDITTNWAMTPFYQAQFT